ncbi:hypothetical protein EV383_2503 [Pseudonocardia sediminis]|uniref:Uncharacterized protein n=1 Tax=Pseudonocardia sediminis TaxID=1397368 RepID=A0A4Q7UUJ9_PSEST|nr:hypothetical protein [Pseudonocardia sediminis]RZT85627.1 hypothetical protein EV383_2503 [Pseudonocardia sediminis]
MPTRHTPLDRVRAPSEQLDLSSIWTNRTVRGGVSLTVAAVVVVSAALADAAPETPGPGVLDTASPAAVATDRPERVRLRGSPQRTAVPVPARPATITFVAAGPDPVVVEVDRTAAPLVVIAVTDGGGPSASGS